MGIHYATQFATLPNRIKEFREMLGWNYAKLSTATGIGITRLQELEAGVGRPRVDTCHRLAAGLGATVDELFPRPAELDGQYKETRLIRRP